jgi:redox-sensitive bicupin YhaK (pirin superfamily)
MARGVDRVVTKRRLGPDAQVDDKALVFDPGNPVLTDPFLVMVEDWFSAPGFDWHPHRGLETVTTVLDGVLEHGDSLGNAGALHPGDVQWMTAGRGIIHREVAFRDEHAHTLQLWLNLPSGDKMADTRYQDLLTAARPKVTLPGAVIDVASGTVAGVTGPAANHWPIQGAVVTVDPASTVDYPLPADHRAFAYVLSGSLSIAGRAVAAGEVAWSDPAAGPLRLVTPDQDEQSVVMIYSGRPIGEPVVLGGPFVMNAEAEIEQAFRDFRAGRFGEVPRQARLEYDR